MANTNSDPAAFIEYAARNLVKNPNDVKVLPVKGSSALVIELRVNPADLGSIIGKNGRIAKALRYLLSSINIKVLQQEDGTTLKYSKILLEIIDD